MKLGRIFDEHAGYTVRYELLNMIQSTLWDLTDWARNELIFLSHSFQ